MSVNLEEIVTFSMVRLLSIRENVMFVICYPIGERSFPIAGHMDVGEVVELRKIFLCPLLNVCFLYYL